MENLKGYIVSLSGFESYFRGRGVFVCVHCGWGVGIGVWGDRYHGFYGILSFQTLNRIQLSPIWGLFERRGLIAKDGSFFERRLGEIEDLRYCFKPIRNGVLHHRGVYI